MTFASRGRSTSNLEAIENTSIDGVVSEIAPRRRNSLLQFVSIGDFRTKSSVAKSSPDDILNHARRMSQRPVFSRAQTYAGNVADSRDRSDEEDEGIDRYTGHRKFGKLRGSKILRRGDLMDLDDSQPRGAAALKSTKC